MRNISVYPVTLEESIKAVEKAYLDACEKERSPEAPIGGIHVAVLLDAVDRLKNLQYKDNESLY